MIIYSIVPTIKEHINRSFLVHRATQLSHDSHVHVNTYAFNVDYKCIGCIFVTKCVQFKHVYVHIYAPTYIYVVVKVAFSTCDPAPNRNTSHRSYVHFPTSQHRPTTIISQTDTNRDSEQQASKTRNASVYVHVHAYRQSTNAYIHTQTAIVPSSDTYTCILYTYTHTLAAYGQIPK